MSVGRAWVTERKGCIIGRHLECNYLHPPSISIPFYRRGGVTLLRWKRLLTTKSAYTRPNFTFTRHRRPVFHSRLSANLYDFPRPISTRECVTTGSLFPSFPLNRDRTPTRLMIDQCFADSSSPAGESLDGNYQTCVWRFCNFPRLLLGKAVRIKSAISYKIGDGFFSGFSSNMYKKNSF